MRNHFLTTLFVFVGWAFFAPAPWVASMQAQSPTSPIVVSAYPYSNSSTLSGSNYSGNAADNSLGGYNVQGWEQDWYSLPMVAGQTYWVSVYGSQSANYYAWSILSLQNPAGNQIDAGEGEAAISLPFNSGTRFFVQYPFTAAASGTYTLIFAQPQGYDIPYTITIQTSPPGPGTSAAFNPIKSIGTPTTTPYTDAGTLTDGTSGAASYYGPADGSIGSPPVNQLGSFWWWGANTGQNMPAWADYYQNWYSATMNVGSTYYVSLSCSSAAPALSIMNSTGKQVAFNSASGTATLVFSPSASDTYTIIASTTSIGPGALPLSYNLSVQQLVQGSVLVTVGNPWALVGGGTTTNTNVTVTVTSLVPSTSPPNPVGSVTVTVAGNTFGPVAVSPAAGNTSTAVVPVTVPTNAGTVLPLTAAFVGTAPYQNANLPNGTLAVLGTPIMVGQTVNPTFSSSCYTGGAADTSLSFPVTGSLGGGSPNQQTGDTEPYQQNWYGLTVTAAMVGTPFLVTMPVQGGNPVLSVQDPTGKQIAWAYDGYIYAWYGWPIQASFTATIQGTYLIIVGCQPSYPIPGNTAPLFIQAPSLITTKPLTLPLNNYTDSLTTSSYYGPGAAYNIGAPPPAPPQQWGGVTLPAESNWSDYLQQWYTVSLTGGTSYGFSVTGMSGTNPVLSIQDASSKQVAFLDPATPTASLVYTPSATTYPGTNTFTIIVSNDTGANWICGLQPTSYTMNSMVLTGPQTPTITINAPKAWILPGTGTVLPVSASVTVTAAFGTPVGTVTMTVNGANVTTQPVTLVNGSATITFTPPQTAGSYPIVVTYTSSDPGFANGTQSGSLTVSPVPIFTVSSYPYSNSGTLSAASFNGNAPDASLAGGGYNVQGWQQDWYSLPMIAGQQYWVSVWSTDGYANWYWWSILSLQDPTGKQVDAGEGEGAIPWNGVGVQYPFTPATTGTYTLIWACPPGYNMGYQLNIQTAPPGPGTTGAFAPITAIPAVTLSTPYSAPGTITVGPNGSGGSYYGPADATIGSPPISQLGNYWWWGANTGQNMPAWTDYWQNWYGVSLAQGTSYYISMSCSGATPVISIMNSAGKQVAYNTQTGTAAMSFTPGTSDTYTDGKYTIICSTTSFGPTALPISYNVGVQVLVSGATITAANAPPASSTSPNATVNVTVTSLVPGSGNPQGSVNVSVDGGAPISFPLTPSGTDAATATCTVPTPMGGGVQHTVSVNYVPNGVTTSAMPWLASSGTCTMAVLQIVALAVPASLAVVAYCMRKPRQPKHLGLAVA